MKNSCKTSIRNGVNSAYTRGNSAYGVLHFIDFEFLCPSSGSIINQHNFETTYLLTNLKIKKGGVAGEI